MAKKKITPLTKEEFLKKVKQLNLKTTSQQLLAALSLAGQIAMNQPNVQGQVPQVYAMEKEDSDEIVSQVSKEEHDEIFAKMVGMVNRPSGHLAKDEELYLEQQLSDILDFEVTAELDEHRLNHSLGIMGGEQHLQRFAGDVLSGHDAYQEAGIAPGRGAFGWFTENGKLSEKAIQQEKYYFAVQTLYLPEWNTSYKDLKPWYKFRKMIMINPSESVAVVGVVGDAGPAQWVKKQFGGSPEVIREGKVWSPKSKGKIILWFVDDPEDKIPLGPIDLSWENLQ
ncbi:MAG: hypothetical protein HN981_00450 [Candidatus Pacebacteria bacterium]|jgi:hypothetical protein|nr:hypothetical protein [Candidatus Paceibacterota bacterium]MBT4651932.1 hypothetical protein [Candidatus Paceibacterota bacterium]MBT6755954.1 hypothetical protein [Candidatus Paceibacterota bacterium]MBT6920853.1 hypothetical protein [Candidatus Paceibacterota bacterium]